MDSKYLIFDIKQNNYFKNEQLELIFDNGNYHLNAINNDTIIILNQTKANSKNVILSYEINSNVDTIFQIFYVKDDNSNYNGIDTFAIPLKIGNNKINLLIPAGTGKGDRHHFYSYYFIILQNAIFKKII